MKLDIKHNIQRMYLFIIIIIIIITIIIISIIIITLFILGLKIIKNIYIYISQQTKMKFKKKNNEKCSQL